MAKRQPFQIVLVPFPLTPLAALGYFLYRQVSLITNQSHVCYHYRPNSKAAQEEVLTHTMILRLFGPGLDQQLRELVSLQLQQQDRYVALRWLNFFQGPQGKYRKVNHENLTRLCLDVNLESPYLILQRTTEYLRRCLLGEKIDPFKQCLPEAVSLDHPTAPVVVTRSMAERHLTLPVFRSSKPGETVVTGSREIILIERQILELMNQRIGVVVGGPARSGKSTLTATLVKMMQGVIGSLNLPIEVVHVNLDLGTPTIDAIANGTGQDRAALLERKRPWTVDLAFEALDNFFQAKARAQIVIADLPGKIDYLTEIISAPADAGILITRDWDEMNAWQRFLGRMGIIKLAQARTRLEEEGLGSVVRRYHPTEILAGRVSGLDRVIRGEDPFISYLAEILLFDLLPSMADQRQQKIQRLLKGNS